MKVFLFQDFFRSIQHFLKLFSLSLSSIQCALSTPHSLGGMYPFSPHQCPTTRASCALSDVSYLACSLLLLSLYTCVLTFFGLLPDFCGSCSVITSLPFCPFSHPPQHPLALCRYNMYIFHVQLITFSMVCPKAVILLLMALE